MSRILVVDDERSILESLEMFLGEKHHEVLLADTAEEALALFHRHQPEVVILDIRLPDRDGLEVLSEIQACEPRSKVIMITAFHDMESTIQAMKNGAYDYLHKPFDPDDVEKAVNRALDILEVDRETPLGNGLDRPPSQEILIGNSEKMREIFKMIGLLCQNRATVCIRGETGTGKELMARVIHRNSPFCQEPFVTLDCSAVVENLIESELFGHEQGAFTGATRTKRGKIELAGNGTLLLDEVGELPLGLQGKFLGFLERREYTRVGGQETLKSKCRIIAATKRDLSGQVKNGLFKEDLYFRLGVVNVFIPPLRERISDVPDLVDYFLQKINQELGSAVTKLQRGVMDRLTAHPWDGNVRELKNVLVAAVVRARGNVILLEEIDEILRTQPSPSGGLSIYSLPEVEKQHIENTLTHSGWNRTRSARMLGISLPTLRSKIRKYGIVPP
ncbi:MAG: sigma-54 dependent transcriptional regulator [Deltaproteobacteria bacterium]|nr:sigma-54 dependent transcriptional regulator [Deltaproteobacteria bacterium]